MKALKKYLKTTTLFKVLYFSLRFFPEFFRDALAYTKHSKTFFAVSKGQLAAQALELMHAIEKGFAIRETRSVFGIDKAERLSNIVDIYESQFGKDEITRSSQEVLAEHKAWHKGQVNKNQLSASVRLVKKKTVDSSDLHQLIRQRVSTRQFADTAPNASALAAALQTAKSAPSSCNRQASRLHYYSDRDKIRELLSYQGGANSFLDEIPALAIITTDIGAWDSANERSQGLVDSGMFAMNFILGLEAEGLASCPLNLAVIHHTERAIKIAGRIPSNERLVVAVAIGQPEDEIQVAKSTRLQDQNIFVYHKND